MAGTNTISGTITASDVAGTVVVSRAIPAISLLTAVVGNWLDTLIVGAGPVSLQMPPITGLCLNLYIRNTSATQTITVTWTPQGGVSNVVLTLGPNDILLLWHSATSASAGVTAVSLSGSAAGAQVEAFIGA